jgi:hypothetical protein
MLPAPRHANWVPSNEAPNGAEVEIGRLLIRALESLDLHESQQKAAEYNLRAYGQ